jgi:hypothetical protein
MSIGCSSGQTAMLNQHWWGEIRGRAAARTADQSVRMSAPLADLARQFADHANWPAAAPRIGEIRLAGCCLVGHSPKALFRARQGGFDAGSEVRRNQHGAASNAPPVGRDRWFESTPLQR